MSGRVVTNSLTEKFQFSLNQYTSTKEEIWYVAVGESLITITPFGSYGKFIKKLGADYDIVRERYYEPLIDAGGMSVGMARLMDHYNQELNTRDLRIRLLIAIHFFTEEYRGCRLDGTI